jgi:hypothetical protein
MGAFLLGYLTTLSVSTRFNVDDRLLNEGPAIREKKNWGRKAIN